MNGTYFVASWIDNLPNMADQYIQQQVKLIDKQIKAAVVAKANAATLDDKLECQRQQRELEAARSQLRLALFDCQDALQTVVDRIKARTAA